MRSTTLRIAICLLTVVPVATACGGDDDATPVDEPSAEAATDGVDIPDTVATDDVDTGLNGMAPCRATGELTVAGEATSLVGAEAGVQVTNAGGPPAFYQVLVTEPAATISLYSSGNGFTANVVVGVDDDSFGSDLDPTLDIRADGSGVDVDVTTVVPVAGDPGPRVVLELTCP